MANWYGTSRSNYFLVKDADGFKAWAKRRSLTVLRKQAEPEVFGICPDDSGDDGAWPFYDVETDEEIDLYAELAAHLQKGQVAVLMQAGAEKLRYVTGSAVAVNHKGRVVSVSLDDIYAKAARSFRMAESEITPATY